MVLVVPTLVPEAPVASRNVVTTEPRVSLQAHALHDAGARPHTFTLDPGATRAQEAKDTLPEQHVVVPEEQPPVPSSPPSSEGSPLQCVVDEQPPSLEAMHMQVEDMLKQVLMLQERDQMHKSQIAMQDPDYCTRLSLIYKTQITKCNVP